MTMTNPLIGTPAISPAGAIFDPLMIGRMAAFGSFREGSRARSQVQPKLSPLQQNRGQRSSRVLRSPSSRVLQASGDDYFSQSHQQRHQEVGSRQHSNCSHRRSHTESVIPSVQHEGWREPGAGCHSAQRLANTHNRTTTSRHHPTRNNWDHQSGAPDRESPEPIYRTIPRPNRSKAESLPEPPINEEFRRHLHGYERQRYNTQPNTHPPRPSAMCSPSSDGRRSCLSPKTVRLACSPEQRPGMMRRHTDYTTSPTLHRSGSHRAGRSSSQDPLKLTSLGAALPFSTPSAGYISPLAMEEEYDPYMAHPAALSPTSALHSYHGRISVQPEDTSEIASGPDIPTGEYVPPGFPKPTQNTPWNREGPAMKTHGIPWQRDVETLPFVPRGPRWVQARPPRTNGGEQW